MSKVMNRDLHYSFYALCYQSIISNPLFVTEFEALLRGAIYSIKCYSSNIKLLRRLAVGTLCGLRNLMFSLIFVRSKIS